MAFKLMLDPGHAEMGNPYYGEYGKQGITEGRQMWKLSGFIMDYIAENYRDVQVGRTKKILNSNPALATRGKMAAGHDCFLSLHTNAGSTVKRGTYMYYAVGDADGSSKRLAIYLADEIGDRIFGHADNLSREVARIHPTMTNRSYYGVLRAAEATDVKDAIMCEIGYHTNDKDLSTIATDSGLRRIAKVMCDSLAQWYGWRPKSASGGGVPLKPNQVVVENGDTLSRIAMRYLGAGSRYKEIVALNNIKDPNLIRPGQILMLPDDAFGFDPITPPKETAPVTPPSAPAALDKAAVRRGNTGAIVYVLQHAINVHTDAKLVLDGSFGPATEAAVKAFQKTQKITVDGIVGASTWDRLLRGSR